MRRLVTRIALAAVLALPVAAAAQPDAGPAEEPTDAGPTEEAAPPADGGTAPDQPAQPQVVPPALLQPAAPAYPQKALDERVHAVVVVELEIGIDGTVSNATVGSLTVIPEQGEPRSGDGRYGFGPAAVEAAKQMVFSPATYGGEPFAVQINFTYRFVLPEKPPEEVVEDPEPVREPRVNYRGALLERGTRSTVPGATVTVYRGEGDTLEGFEATTGADGSFQFYDLPAGVWSVRIEREGYVPVETDETFTADEVVEGTYWIEKGSYSPYDLTIEAERPRKEVNRRSLSVAEIEKVPGTISNDPVLVIENLPGVARSGPVGGEIIVRGSGPEDTGVYVNGIEVPLIYHFGGLKSIVPANVIGGIDFYPGNYSVAYGRALGGILDLQLKRLAPDAIHGSADVSVLDTSLYLEVPINDEAAIAFAGRRSYIDFVLDAAIPEDADIALINAPRYYDYQVLGNWRPQQAQEIRWLVLGSDDLFELLFDDPADAGSFAESNDFRAQTRFQRAIVDHRYTPNEKLSNLLRLSLGRDRVDFSALGAFQLSVDVVQVQVRDTVSWNLDEHFSLDLGFDTAVNAIDGLVRLPVVQNQGDDPGEVDINDIRTSNLEGADYVDLAPFAEARITLGPLSLVPGLRLDYFGQVEEVSLDPRLSVRYELPADVTLKAGAAVVHQDPPIYQIDPVFGNPDLGLQRAFQYSIGAEWRPTEVIKADVTLFYKDMDNLVSPTPALIERDGQMVPAVFDNGGEGRVYGAELFLEHDFSNNFRGWISYTLSRGERRDSGAMDWRLFDYDQPHILAVVGSYTLPGNWEVGARWRLVSGSPYTPIVGGVFDSALDQYLPINGEVNSDRLPMFQQLDARVDKTFVFNTWKLAAYLSLINSTNHENVESVTYNYDFSERGSVNGLPIIPVFGLKGEW